MLLIPFLVLQLLAASPKSQESEEAKDKNGPSVGEGFLWNSIIGSIAFLLISGFSGHLPKSNGKKNRRGSKKPKQPILNNQETSLQECVRLYDLQNNEVATNFFGQVVVHDNAAVKRKYHKLSLEYHPDKNKENPEPAAEKFLKVANCYEDILVSGSKN